MKVFVLIRDSICYSNNVEINVSVYNSISDARATMKKEYNAELNDWKQSFDDDEMFEVEVEKNSRSIWESGRYIENHIAWEIEEKEVIE